MVSVELGAGEELAGALDTPCNERVGKGSELGAGEELRCT